MNGLFCYACKFMKKRSGDFVECIHPVALEHQDEESRLSSLESGCFEISLAAKMGVVGSAYGITNGFFIWPYKFHPAFLKRCESFQKSNPQGDNHVMDRK